MTHVRRLPGAWLLTAAALVGVACSTVESEPRRAADGSIAVATFNVHHGQGVDGIVDLDRTADTIRDSGADIVGVQEVDRHFDGRSGFRDQLAELGVLLDMAVMFSPTIDLPPAAPEVPRRQYGNAVLSRYPITSGTTTLLPTADASEPRAALDATIDAPGGPLHVVVTHLSAGSERERREQALALSEHLGGRPERTVVLIDANAGPRSTELAALLGPMSDAWVAGTGSGNTHPSDDPRRRIDFVLVSPDLTVLDARVVDTVASDHRPVVASVAGAGD